jgi:exonuclease VII small subunit
VLDYFTAMSTVREIEAAIEKLPLPERLRLYKDTLQLIGRSAEDLDSQRLGLENFFHDDSPEDQLELTDEVKTKLDQSHREIAEGRYATRQPK